MLTKTHYFGLGLTCLLAFNQALAANLTIQVINIKSDQGTIGCALYRSADGFPMEPEKSIAQNYSADQSGVSCSYTGLEPGTYAVSVSHDANNNGEVDTNLFGVPKEDWGATNNVRPLMRAPTFEEARFVLENDLIMTVEID